jgi:hypothetical protein
MKLTSLFAFLLLPTLAPAESEWMALFDGKSLSGWSQADGSPPGAGWSVQEGMIHLKGEGGNLVSAASYSEFELEWEWKVATGANNGVKYWVTEIGPKKEMLGLEYQMIDDLVHPDASKEDGKRSTASLYDIKAAATDKASKPAGEWNQSRIVVKAGKIEHWLNGKLAVSADTTIPEWQEQLAKSKFKGKAGFAPGDGKLMLTDHHDETWYRNIRIRKLAE